MGRKIGGVVVGLLAAGLVVWLVESLGFDAPAPDLALVPRPALLSVALAWILGPLVGGLVATRVGRSAGPLPALVVGVFFFAADVANLFMIPSPAWLWVVGLLAPLPAAWLGFALARRRRPPS